MPKKPCNCYQRPIDKYDSDEDGGSTMPQPGRPQADKRRGKMKAKKYDISEGAVDYEEGNSEGGSTNKPRPDQAGKRRSQEKYKTSRSKTTKRNRR